MILKMFFILSFSEHLGQLEFLNMCIKESLRLHSPVTNIFRRTSKKTTFHDGRTAPAGAVHVNYKLLFHCTEKGRYTVVVNVRADKIK